MNNSPSYFEIQADNPARAINFYRQLLGWKFTEVKGLPVAYWQIDTDGSKGGLLQRPVAVPKGPAGTNAYVCSMQVENFDAAAETIAQLGGQVAMAKFAVPGKCWQGYFIDTEGNTFGLYQVDLNAGL